MWSTAVDLKDLGKLGVRFLSRSIKPSCECGGRGKRSTGAEEDMGLEELCGGNGGDGDVGEVGETLKEDIGSTVV